MSKDAMLAKLTPATRPDADLLPVLAAAHQELTAAKTLPDVLPVIHLAAAVASAAERAAKLAGVRGGAIDVVQAANETAREAAVLRIEAQARAGDLLHEMAHRGERDRGHGDHRSESHRATPMLGDLGITKSESSRWQRVAAVPTEVRRAYAGEARTSGREVTVNGLLRYARTKREETIAEEPGRGPGAGQLRARQARDVSRDVMTAEARALHAVLADDVDDAARILSGFLPGELRALQRACGLLGALCVDVRRDPFPAPGPVTPSQHGSHALSPAVEAGVAGPGAAGAARASRTFPSPSPKSAGGADLAPPELGEDPSN